MIIKLFSYYSFVIFFIFLTVHWRITMKCSTVFLKGCRLLSSMFSMRCFLFMFCFFLYSIWQWMAIVGPDFSSKYFKRCNFTVSFVTYHGIVPYRIVSYRTVTCRMVVVSCCFYRSLPYGMSCILFLWTALHLRAFFFFFQVNLSFPFFFTLDVLYL